MHNCVMISMRNLSLLSSLPPPPPPPPPTPTHLLQSYICMHEVASTPTHIIYGYFHALLDIDECTAGADNCDTNATCTNTLGGFTCTCNQGYTGDGVTCMGKYIPYSRAPPIDTFSAYNVCMAGFLFSLE